MIRDFLSHWRVTLGYLLLVVAVSVGFLVDANLQDTVDQESLQRRVELCEAINNQRELLIEIVSSAAPPSIPEDASDALVRSIEEAKRNHVEVQELAQELLDIEDCTEDDPPNL